MATGAVTWLYSPRLPAWQKKLVLQIKRRVPPDRDVIWVLSSGTQSVDEVKAIALPLKALRTSAMAVNTHLRASSKDRWLVALPEYHIGGYSIGVRARLSRAKVFRSKRWSAVGFLRAVERDRITLTSLVPTQVFDLVREGLVAPKCLRAIVVGGGALDADLQDRALQLGWPVLVSYGLTECASQVATARILSPKVLKVLPHVKVKIEGQRLFLKSPALCRWVARLQRDGEFSLEDPLREAGWFPTSDLAEVSGALLRLLGRCDDVVKVSGVLVNVSHVEQNLRSFMHRLGLGGRVAVVAVSDPRHGRTLVLVTDSSDSLRAWEEAVKKMNDGLSSPQRLRRVYFVPRIPVSALGKVLKAELAKDLGFEG